MILDELHNAKTYETISGFGVVLEGAQKGLAFIKHRNGQVIQEIDFESLPTELKQAYANRLKADSTEIQS